MVIACLGTYNHKIPTLKDWETWHWKGHRVICMRGYSTVFQGFGGSQTFRSRSKEVSDLKSRDICSIGRSWPTVTNSLWFWIFYRSYVTAKLLSIPTLQSPSPSPHKKNTKTYGPIINPLSISRSLKMKWFFFSIVCTLFSILVSYLLWQIASNWLVCPILYN